MPISYIRVTRNFANPIKIKPFHQNILKLLIFCSENLNYKHRLNFQIFGYQNKEQFFFFRLDETVTVFFQKLIYNTVDMMLGGTALDMLEMGFAIPRAARIPVALAALVPGAGAGTTRSMVAASESSVLVELNPLPALRVHSSPSIELLRASSSSGALSSSLVTLAGSCLSSGSASEASSLIDGRKRELFPPLA